MKSVAQFERVSWKQYCEGRGWDSNELNLTPPTPHMEEYEGIKLPKRATVGSAGYDFYAPFNIELKVGETIKIPTGIRCKITNGCVLSLYPRSGLGFKYRLRLNNTVGIIDSDYYNSDNEGHIFIKLSNEGDKSITIKKGEAFCQGMFTEFCVTFNDSTDGVRNGGFGSTSK